MRDANAAAFMLQEGPPVSEHNALMWPPHYLLYNSEGLQTSSTCPAAGFWCAFMAEGCMSYAGAGLRGHILAGLSPAARSSEALLGSVPAECIVWPKIASKPGLGWTGVDVCVQDELLMFTGHSPMPCWLAETLEMRLTEALLPLHSASSQIRSSRFAAGQAASLRTRRQRLHTFCAVSEVTSC